MAKDGPGIISVKFRYDPLRVEKVKSVPRHKWHPAEKYWRFPNDSGTLEKILKVFEGEEIHIDPALQAQKPSTSVIARTGATKQSHPSPDALLKHEFEDLRRELLSRKYSYKTVKGYIYYNRDFLNFTDKGPSEVNDDDVKDYLLYLAEEKESATATINQAINALKFYYGSMLKRKFVYEVKRPRKEVSVHNLR
ncbi:MAG: site-specific integrase, partial [Thermodesulfovibrionales bacterium]|nr:site-specific integrase [Thermodesulfovibrionales bacterium]